MIWDDLKFFLSVARTGSLSGAAEQLKSSPATVSRRLGQLERSLGIKLFSHHQTGYVLTDEGAAMMDKAEAAEDAFLTVERQAEGHTLATSGHVRLATAENIANHVIIPALPGFRAQYPNITLEIHTGVTSLNLTRREADIALRLSRPRQGNVSIRKIGEQAYALYGAAGYVETLPRTGAKLLKAAEYIGWAEEYGNLAMKEWLEDVAPAHQPILVTHSLFAQLMAAKSGLGLALLPCFLGDAEPGLKRLESSVDGKTQEIWLVTHQDLKNSRRVSAVADFLTRLVHRNANLFGGKTTG